MADRLSPGEELLNSQEFRDSLFDTQQNFSDLFDDEIVAVSEVTRVPIPAVEMNDANIDSHGGATAVDNIGCTTQDNQEISTELPKKRQRFKFAQRHILADYRLYLKPECSIEMRVDNSLMEDLPDQGSNC